MSADDDFRRELEALINRHSRENGSYTPDFILAHYLAGCLTVFDETVKWREQWYGRGGAATAGPGNANDPVTTIATNA